jgi:hypothetical protein
MSDPPVTHVSAQGEVKEGEVEAGDGLVHVKEGYFRYIDVLFEWCKYMNPWQVSQLKRLGDELINRKTLSRHYSMQKL